MAPMVRNGVFAKSSFLAHEEDPPVRWRELRTLQHILQEPRDPRWRYYTARFYNSCEGTTPVAADVVNHGMSQ